MPSGGNRGVIGALIMGVLLVGGAYTLRSDPASEEGQVAGIEHVISQKAATREFIKTIDSDQDGVKDWEEAVQRDFGSIPLSTSTEPVERTATAVLGITLLEEIVHSKNAGPFGKDQQEIINEALTSMPVLDVKYTAADIITHTKTDEASMRAYFNSLAEIIARNAPETPTENEAVVLERALAEEDPALLAPLSISERMYANMSDEMLTLAVPQQYANLHLRLLNAYNRIVADTKAMQMVFEDPLPALLHVQRYEQDATELFDALQGVYVALETSPFVFTNRDMAIIFTNFRP